MFGVDDMVRYRHNTIVQVVFRLDFSQQLPFDSQSAREFFIRDYPIYEEIPAYALDYVINRSESGQISTQQKATPYTIMIFTDRNNEVRLTVDRSFVGIDLFKYESFDSTKSVFFAAIDKLLSFEKLPTINRVALRYINNIDMLQRGATEIGDYLALSLPDIDLPSKGKRSDLQTDFVRSYFEKETVVDDYRIVCRTGYMNPDYPAPMRKHIYTLDYDAFVMGEVASYELKTYIDKLHAIIQTAYENHITDTQRTRMEVITDE